MPLRRLLLLGSLTTLGAVPVAAQTTGGPARPAAFLFAYRPGDRAAFDAGYREHLNWHRQAGDTLVWYGWDVLTGDDLGVFVDGVFGATLGAIDRRVDPVGDARDGAATFEPHATALWRRLYLLRPDLGASSFLEDRKPSPLLQVYTVTVASGAERAAEARFVEGRASGAAYTVYQALDGAAQRTYLVLAPRAGISELQTLGAMLHLRPWDWSRAADPFAGIASATWRYRADLAYVPSGSPPR